MLNYIYSIRHESKKMPVRPDVFREIRVAQHDSQLRFLHYVAELLRIGFDHGNGFNRGNGLEFGVTVTTIVA